MSTQQKVHVKLQHNNEFRRFVIEPESSFNDLKQKISTILNISSPISIRYLDEESEWITIDSDSELLTGIEISPRLLRLQIIVPTQSPTNPVQNSEQTSDNVDEPKWKRYRKFRNSEKGGENDDCGKWRRKCHKWRNENSEKDSNENDDCGKWKRKRCNRWRKENPETSLEQNNATSDQTVDVPSNNVDVPSNNVDEPKWKRYRKCHYYRNSENEPTTDDCPKWKRFRKNRNDNTDHTDANGEMRGRGRRGRGRWAHMIENSDSDSIEEKSAEEINKEIGSLKEEAKLLLEKKKGVWQEVVGLKEQIKNLRQNDGAKEDIVKLREQIVEKKKTCQQYQMQVVFSKNRIWKLKSALVIKADN